MDNKRLITIAIDGFSSSGKSTMAKKLAKTIGYAYIDTGAMYRAVTLYCLRNGLFDGDRLDTERLEAALPDINITFGVDADGKTQTMLNGEVVEQEIRRMEVSSKVSIVAAVGSVRRALVKQQQAMGKQKGIVMDGRDIGTVVFPDAELKIFVTATAEIRAMRRYKELQAKGMPADFDDILKNVEERDYIDTHRATSPLRQADDALVLDNSNLTIAEQKQWLMKMFEERTK